MKVTYQIRIRIDADPELIWIDEFVDRELHRSFGPYWSLATAVKQINQWEAEAKQ